MVLYEQNNTFPVDQKETDMHNIYENIFGGVALLNKSQRP